MNDNKTDDGNEIVTLLFRTTKARRDAFDRTITGERKEAFERLMD